MQLNAVMYNLMVPAALAAPDGSENWTAYAGAATAAELEAAAKDHRLPRWVIVCVVCIAAGGLTGGLVLPTPAAPNRRTAN